MFQRRKYFLKNGGMGFVERSPEQMIVPTNALRCIALRCVALRCVGLERVLPTVRWADPGTALEALRGCTGTQGECC